MDPIYVDIGDGWFYVVEKFDYEPACHQTTCCQIACDAQAEPTVSHLEYMGDVYESELFQTWIETKHEKKIEQEIIKAVKKHNMEIAPTGVAI